MRPFRKEVPSILIQLICVCYFIRKHFIWNGFITFYVFMYTNICTSFTLKRAILLKNRSKHYLWIESWRRNPSARLLSDQDRISKLRPFISHVPRLKPRTFAFFLRCKIVRQNSNLLQMCHFSPILYNLLWVRLLWFVV